jgi:hypothetical protein
MLKQMAGPKPSLRDILVARLESSLANAQIPPANLAQHAYEDLTMMGSTEPSWQIFDQSSLEHMMYSDWTG